DRVAEEDGEQALPPVHPGLDQARGEHVGRDADGKAHPERGEVPEVPGAPRQRYRRQVGVEVRRRRQRLGELDQAAHGRRAPSPPPARAAARSSARRVSTRASCRRYAAEAWMSDGGSMSSPPASAAAARSASSVGVAPGRDAIARRASTGPSPTEKSAILAPPIRPASSSDTIAATPTRA